jgi:hypothetical protein
VGDTVAALADLLGARTARATSAVSALRVLWNTVSSTSRRPGASQ